MKEPLDINVVNINNRFHARLYDRESGSIIDEMACKQKQDISYICGIMLRWADKLGYVSPMASSSRSRMKNIQEKGKIWYRNQL